MEITRKPNTAIWPGPGGWVLSATKNEWANEIEGVLEADPILSENGYLGFRCYDESVEEMTSNLLYLFTRATQSNEIVGFLASNASLETEGRVFFLNTELSDQDWALA